MKNPIKLLPDTIKSPLDLSDVEHKAEHPAQAKDDVKNYLRDELFTLNYYRLHMLYFLVTIAISSVIVYGAELAQNRTGINGSKLRYVDGLFLCTSAMTSTGLTTVNLGEVTAFTQAVLAILLFMGNVTFVSTGVVWIRRHFFRKKLADIVQHSQAARQLVGDIDQAGAEKAYKVGPRGSFGDRTKSRRRARIRPETDATQTRRKSHYQTGMGTWPAPWETRLLRQTFSRPMRWLKDGYVAREYGYLTFAPSFDKRGRFRELTEDERCELGGVEYRALGVLLWILSAYQIIWLALGTVFLVPYSYRQTVVDILHGSQPGNLNPGWWAFFSVITSYCNGGLNLLNANFIPFNSFYYILMVASALTVAGNTQFPIFLRFMIWAIGKCCPKDSRLQHSLKFLLNHPRRCFLYLFPSKETWLLLAIQLVIDLTMWLLFIILNIGLPAFEALPWGTRVYDGLFQATGLRTSGAYIATLSSLAPALLVAYLIAMYISSYPIVMALRQTNTYSERSIGLDQGESGGGLGQHFRRQLAYDIWFQLLAWFLICVIERPKLTGGQDGFSSFSILFEITSAYGTVGLSTGVSYDAYSLCGAFQTLSKIVLLFVMVRGRHRGLPLAIDRSILLPGDELMKKMDRDYNNFGMRGMERDGDAAGEEEKVLLDSGGDTIEAGSNGGKEPQTAGR